MLVKDLIERLGKLDPLLTVVLDGYEAGFAEDVQVCIVYLKRNGHGTRDGIYGRHSRPDVEACKPEKDWDMTAAYIGEGRCLGHDYG
jgi:hypothetical protein